MTSNYKEIREANIRKYGEETKHLDVFRRLYSDRTHFVYELLQNAEDAGATKVQFILRENELEILHDGKEFNESDVRGICGLVAGTKSKDLTKIGKFGIGFKSVYAYTASPEIHCGSEHFCIENYVRPYATDSVEIPDSWTTMFNLPFNSARIVPESAFREIANRLSALNVRTLLFLRNIGEINWKTTDDKSGIYFRETSIEHTSRRVTVIGESSSEKYEEEFWLVFERRVVTRDGTQINPIEVAYKIQKKKTGDMIEPLYDSPLFVFFATEKNTGMGFLVQGPFRTTPARDNIPNDNSWNLNLVKQVGQLVVESLQHLKFMGLLTVQALEAMPLKEKDFPQGNMFQEIYKAVKLALKKEEFLPTKSGEFVNSNGACIGRGTDIKNLLSPKQLTKLLDKGSSSRTSSNPEVQWLTNEISEDRTPELREYLIDELKVANIGPRGFAKRVNREFFEKQDDAWLVDLYKFLLKQGALWKYKSQTIRHKPFIRLEDGSQVSAFGTNDEVAVYLPGKVRNGFSFIKESLLNDREAHKFLSELGIQEPDVISIVIEQVLPIYGPGKNLTIDSNRHANHISLILEALGVDSDYRRQTLLSELRKTGFLYANRADNIKSKYVRPNEGVYLETSKLEIYLEGNSKAWFLDNRYSEIQKDAFVKAGLVLGKVKTLRDDPDWYGNVTVCKEYGWHKRGVDGFDPNCQVNHLAFAVRHSTRSRSCFIWNEIARPLKRQIRGKVEHSTNKNYNNSSTTEEFSKFGKLLTSNTWVIDRNGQFHKPGDLSLKNLPKDFEADEYLASQLEMKGSKLLELAKKAGFDSEDLDFVRELNKFPKILKRAKEMLEKQRYKLNFPKRSSQNHEKRRERAKEQAQNAPKKEFEMQPVSAKSSSLDGDKRTYLRDKYTNENEELICQICKEEMPFRKRNNDHYFEAVQLFDDLVGEHEPAHVALCPLCAAKFKVFVKRDEKQRKCLKEQFENANVKELLVKIDLDEKQTIRFVETHLIDVQSVLEVEKGLK